MAKYEWEEAEKHNPWGKKRVRGSHCSKGHEFTEENTFIRPLDNARVCRQCRKEYARMKYQEKKEQNNGVARLKKQKVQVFELSEAVPLLDKAEPLWYALQVGLSENITPCADKPEFYADRSIEVSAAEAELMCYGCPLIKQCYDFAVAQEVNAGIWGGLHFDQDEGALFDID